MGRSSYQTWPVVLVIGNSVGKAEYPSVIASQPLASPPVNNILVVELISNSEQILLLLRKFFHLFFHFPDIFIFDSFPPQLLVLERHEILFLLKVFPVLTNTHLLLTADKTYQ